MRKSLSALLGRKGADARRVTREKVKGEKVNKDKLIQVVEETTDRKKIEGRKNREKTPVMFVKKRVTIQIGDKTIEGKDAWIAEHVRANFQSRLITKEYYGTMPFPVDEMPEADRGTYDDYEQSIIYTAPDGTERVVDCVFTLVPHSKGVLKCVG